MKTTLHLIVLLASTVAGSCASTPDTGPPDRVASDLVTAIDAGHEKAASKLYARVAGDEEYRQKIYPVLFGAAREHYEVGDVQGALPFLRFMRPRYPDAVAVREGLLYALFIQRAIRAQPDVEVQAEIDGLVEELRERQPQASFWVDLVAAQQAIDDGRLGAAREAFARFLAHWDQRPPELIVYVEDIDRYLASH